jgi:hypothetical protein
MDSEDCAGEGLHQGPLGLERSMMARKFYLSLSIYLKDYYHDSSVFISLLLFSYLNLLFFA